MLIFAQKVWHWMDGWMDGWMNGWMDGWMDGWVGGWVDGRPGLSIAYSNQQIHLINKRISIANHYTFLLSSSSASKPI